MSKTFYCVFACNTCMKNVKSMQEKQKQKGQCKAIDTKYHMIHGTISNGILPDAVGNWVSTSQSEQNRFTHPDIVVLRWHFNCKEYFCLIQLFFCTWYIFGSGVNLYFLNPIVELDLVS